MSPIPSAGVVDLGDLGDSWRNGSLSSFQMFSFGGHADGGGAAVLTFYTGVPDLITHHFSSSLFKITPTSNITPGCSQRDNGTAFGKYPWLL